MGGKPRTQASLGATHSNYSGLWGTPNGAHGSPDWWRWIECTFNRTHDAELFDPCPSSWSPDQPSGLEVPYPVDRPWYVNHPGSKGSTELWWGKAISEYQTASRVVHPPQPALIWCLFSVEQLRFMDPCPLELPGHMVWPLARTPFISLIDYDPAEHGKRGKVRRKGCPNLQPGNWSAFWCSEHVDVCVASLPVPSIVTRTGHANVGRALAALESGIDRSLEHPDCEVGQVRAIASMRQAMILLGGSP